MKRATYELRNELHKRVKRIALEKDITMSALVRELLEGYANAYEAEKERVEKPKIEPRKWTAAYAREHNKK